MSTTVFKFTKPTLEALPFAVKTEDQYRVWDEELSGFGLRVNKHCKKFVVHHKAHGTQHSKSFAEFHPRQEMSIEDARKHARALIVQWDKGNTDDTADAVVAATGDAPTDDKVTLRQALDIYIERCRKKARSTRTVDGYRYDVETFFADWLDRPLASIKRAECVARHTKITAKEFNGRGKSKRKVNGGPAGADKAFRAFTAIHTHYRKRVAGDGFPMNPADAIEKNRVDPCRDVVSEKRLPEWWKETEGKNPIRRDAWRFILLTGLRSNAATSLRFDDIDFDKGTITRGKTVEGMKNRRPFTVPVSRYVLDLLRQRKADNDRDLGKDDEGWVFPTRSGKGCTGPVTHIRDLNDKGFEGTHILRHTLLSLNDESRLGIPSLHERLLVNHGTGKSLGNVTEDYKGLRGLTSLRHSAELITKAILDEVGVSYEIPGVKPVTAEADDTIRALIATLGVDKLKALAEIMLPKKQGAA